MKTVLLVDDDPDVLEITAYMLEEAGYDVVKANNAAEALQVTGERNDIGIVLTDLNLQDGVSGIDMGLTMHHEGLRCPFIVMSGGHEPPQAALHSWITYLPKPFDRLTLLATINGHF